MTTASPFLAGRGLCVHTAIEPSLYIYTIRDVETGLQTCPKRADCKPLTFPEPVGHGGLPVLNTGNRSEGAVGYCTLYGDMVGGFAVLKDVPKTMVYELSRYRNSQAGREVIPQSTIDREPSAELRPGQRDVDSLPPYEVLDPILEAYIGENKGLEEIVAMGFDREVVQKVMSRVDGNEYKRRQAPPGITLVPTRDRQPPMTNRFRER